MSGEPASDDRWDGYLPPRLWAPAALFAVAAIAALGVMLAMNWGNDGGTVNVIEECDPTQPGCELRQVVHWHADLALVINGEEFDFGQSEYVSTVEDPLSDNVHIHDPRHTVVHVHREQTSWGEFFDSVGFNLGDGVLTTPDGTQYVEGDEGQWHYIVNGVAIDSIRFQFISDLDRVLLVYGDLTEEEAIAMWPTVSDQACISSGLCSDRFPPGGIEEEPCSTASLTCN